MMLMMAPFRGQCFHLHQRCRPSNTVKSCNSVTLVQPFGAMSESDDDEAGAKGALKSQPIDPNELAPLTTPAEGEVDARFSD